jgi:hypothetical protein
MRSSLIVTGYRQVTMESCTRPVACPSDVATLIGRFAGSGAWVDAMLAGLLDAAVTVQDRATGTRPTLRVGDRDAPGEPCGFGSAGNVLEQCAWAVRVKSLEERPTVGSFGHPDEP